MERDRKEGRKVYSRGVARLTLLELFLAHAADRPREAVEVLKALNRLEGFDEAAGEYDREVSIQQQELVDRLEGRKA